MKVVALTGSIGMGKSTTAEMFAQLGVPVWDADAAVHRLYAAGCTAVGPVLAAFPDAGSPAGGIDRDALSRQVLGNPDALKRLEAIVHPLVGQDRSNFLARARDDGHLLALVDVPLLFETGGEAHVDQVIVVTCAPEVQRQRVLARPGVTVDKFEAILARQVPDAIKRAKADFVIETDHGLDAAREQVGLVLKALGGTPHT